jgi:hypothetical protein
LADSLAAAIASTHAHTIAGAAAGGASTTAAAATSRRTTAAGRCTEAAPGPSPEAGRPVPVIQVAR